MVSQRFFTLSREKIRSGAVRSGEGQASALRSSGRVVHFLQHSSGNDRGGAHDRFGLFGDNRKERGFRDRQYFTGWLSTARVVRERQFQGSDGAGKAGGGRRRHESLAADRDSSDRRPDRPQE